MEKRRQFIKQVTWLAVSVNFMLHPIFSLVRTAYSQTRKTILPKDTDRNTLKRRNPRSLDTRNLDITPLTEFGTMGQTDYEADMASWRLDISGMVQAPLRLSYTELQALPSIEREVLLICPGFFANYGKWKGVSMKTLLEKVNPGADATQVAFSGPEGDAGKVEHFSLADVRANNVFLAYAVNGQPLPGKHGFPLRVVAEGYYGSDWVKYVDHMKVEKKIADLDPDNPPPVRTAPSLKGP